MVLTQNACSEFAGVFDSLASHYAEGTSTCLSVLVVVRRLAGHISTPFQDLTGTKDRGSDALFLRSFANSLRSDTCTDRSPSPGLLS